jgi:hypothetical protein
MPQGRPHPNKKHHNKGRVPAHQNTTAFRHNPKSKLTDKIVNRCPNEGLCRRCHDKIEWRKQYRKYKLRTQPGICNQCQRRNVTASYHTICQDCAITTKSHPPVKICAMCTKEPALSVQAPQQPPPQDSLMEHCSSTKLRVLRTMERNLRKEQHKQQQEPMSCQDEDGYEEDDFQLEDYIMSEEEDDDIIQFGIPIRDAGLA